MQFAANRCPFHRPFAEQFALCPAYEPEEIEVTNMRDVPLEPIWSCRQLTVGAYPDQRGRLYPKCLLGDVLSRRQVLLEKLLLMAPKGSSAPTLASPRGGGERTTKGREMESNPLPRPSLRGGGERTTRGREMESSATYICSGE